MEKLPRRRNALNRCTQTETRRNKKPETYHEMRIPERDVTYIVSSVYLLTLIHRYLLNRKQFH